MAPSGGHAAALQRFNLQVQAFCRNDASSYVRVSLLLLCILPTVVLKRLTTFVVGVCFWCRGNCPSFHINAQAKAILSSYLHEVKKSARMRGKIFCRTQKRSCDWFGALRMKSPWPTRTFAERIHLEPDERTWWIKSDQMRPSQSYDLCSVRKRIYENSKTSCWLKLNDCKIAKHWKILYQSVLFHFYIL